MKKDHFAVRVWDIVYPLALYYAVTIIMMFAAQFFLGTGTKSYALCQIITGVVVLPVMYRSFYKPDKMVWPFGATEAFFESGRTEVAGSGVDSAGQMKNAKQKSATNEEDSWKSSLKKRRVVNLAFIVVSAALIGFGLNNLILMSPIAAVSTGFAEANSHFYGSTLVLELISSAILTPILEELVYRGIIYARLRRMMNFVPAMLTASLIFAAMHFNLVQFLYAFIFGMVLVIYMERTGNVYGAIAGHITANAIAVIRTETGWLSGTVDGSIGAWMLSGSIFLLGGILLVVYVRRKES